MRRKLRGLAMIAAAMAAVVRQVKQPCFGFKILAAGRLSDRRSWVEQAFRDTYASIKSTDSVIIRTISGDGSFPMTSMMV